jgi:hypothetical protein
MAVLDDIRMCISNRMCTKINTNIYDTWPEHVVKKSLRRDSQREPVITLNFVSNAEKGVIRIMKYFSPSTVFLACGILKLVFPSIRKSESEPETCVLMEGNED